MEKLTWLATVWMARRYELLDIINQINHPGLLSIIKSLVANRECEFLKYNYSNIYLLYFIGKNI